MYRLAELQSKPTIKQDGHYELKVDDGFKRIWLSNLTASDGASYSNQARVEQFIKGKWRETHRYQAR
jgi:hypothetical protein